jgi:3-methylcrotonyl-CoA carboxylase alpha subunit
MRLLGEKAPAKTLAETLGIPVLPGYHGEEQDPGRLAEIADRIGYPLLIKASAGGGGRGMRVVRDAGELSESIEAAQREARASFGNDRILLERYVARPRHVEMQVFGDARGTALYLGERECSIQRRHQKLVEESPSPVVDDELRQQIGAAAVALALAAGYQNAGTVEFLIDENRGFYFLEMNARLQVEHPVTEMVTGLDLVELQLRVASGEPLPLTQNEVAVQGHAMEVRIIAEDPSAGFLPSVGRLTTMRTPTLGPHLRLDTGVQVGDEITPYYDSLLAKLIVWGVDRNSAVRQLQQALRVTHIEGPSTNVPLLLAIAEHPAFQAGDLHTGFLDEYQLIESLDAVPDEVLGAASALVVRHQSSAPEFQDPWRTSRGWRLGGVGQHIDWSLQGRTAQVLISSHAGQPGMTASIGERLVHIERVHEGTVRIGAEKIRLLEQDGLSLSVTWRGRTYRLHREPPPDVTHSSVPSGHGNALAAPMPGRVVKLHVSEGQLVTELEPLLVLEAMKMEHIVTAPHAGPVTKLNVALGDQVTAGAILAEIDGAPG